VRVALAANPSLDADIAAYFTALAEEPVCVALATNPAISADLVQALAATRLPAVLVALAYRDSLYDELVTFLLEHSPDFRRHWAIQRRAASIADAALARQLLADPLPTLRALAVAGHPWRRADLYDFARDPAPAVRLAAVRHAHAPDELLEAALHDDSPEVVAAAAAARAVRAQAAISAKPTRPAPAVAPAPVAPAPSTPADRSGPARTPLPVTPRPARVEAPKLFNQLKRLFWQ
jgi:hypothetical protein